jgi:hypothetical protein
MVCGVSSNLIENFANFENFNMPLSNVAISSPTTTVKVEVPGTGLGTGPRTGLGDYSTVTTVPTIGTGTGPGTGPGGGGDYSTVTTVPAINAYKYSPTSTAPFQYVEEEFEDDESPVYEGFTNSGFTASSLVKGENLNNLLKAVLIALVLCALSHKQVANTVVNPVHNMMRNSVSIDTTICILLFVVAYIVISFL